MRCVLPLGGVIWLLAVGTAAAQSTYTAIISHDDAEVRAGPTDNAQFYVTNRLKRGTTVQVVEELANGWLKIAPPAGSFSWIAAKSVTQFSPTQPQTWIVDGTADVSVPVIIGTEFKQDVPSQIESCRLARPAQVRSVGPARIDDRGIAWLQIEPPPREYRYIRADAVTRSDGSPIVRTATSGATLTAKPGEQTVGTTLTEAETVWQQATLAEGAGNLSSAVDLYGRVAVLAQGTQPHLALNATERANWLRSRLGVAQNHSTFTPSLSMQTLAPPNVQLSGPVDVTTTLTRPQLPPVAASGPGKLRRAGRWLAGQPTYVLESSQNQLLYYATAEPGVNLEPFVNQKVQIFGPSSYSGDLRANYMRVERVQLAQ